METRCPECDKRLRLPETYSNQKIRCRNCGAIFRPVGVATNVEIEPTQHLPEDAPDTAHHPSPPEPASAPARPATRSRSGGGGFGIALVVALMLLTRIPRLFKDFGKRDRNRPVPAEVHEENRQVRQDEFLEVDERIEIELAEPGIVKKDQAEEVDDPESDDAAEFQF